MNICFDPFKPNRFWRANRHYNGLKERYGNGLNYCNGPFSQTAVVQPHTFIEWMNGSSIILMTLAKSLKNDFFVKFLALIMEILLTPGFQYDGTYTEPLDKPIAISGLL